MGFNSGFKGLMWYLEKETMILNHTITIANSLEFEVFILVPVFLCTRFITYEILFYTILCPLLIPKLLCG